MSLKNWMQKIPDNANIKNINMPGTHDSCTRFCEFSLFTRCQNLSVYEQLNAGARVIDLRVNGDAVVHSFAKCKKSRFGETLKTIEVIVEITRFLTENPTETVVLMFKNDGKISGEKCLQLFVENIINQNKNLWYLEKTFPELSTVRGKIVFINRINSKLGIDFSKMPYQGNNDTLEVQTFSVNDFESVTLQDRCNCTVLKKWEKAVLPLLENPENCQDNFIINYLSTAGFPLIPKFNSFYINKAFSKYNLTNRKFYGIIMIDFINAEISEKIINSNF